MPSDNATYDIIFVGGGTAACVTAGRLAQADPSLKILILETGPLTQEVADHIQPARYFSNLVLPSETFTHHVGKPSPSLAGRAVIVPTGRCVGGGSSVNFAMYTRAAASDYDDWEIVHKNPGWGSKQLISLLKKAETFQNGGDAETHGTSGPIKASFADENFNVGSQFLAVAAQYDKDREFSEDTNAFHTCNVYGRWPRYVDLTNGRRSDTPHNYIYDKGHNGLTILERRRVVRVIFENDRAVGVEHIRDGRSEKGVQEPAVSLASRLVVVSAGAFGSPAILERSGIGAADILKKNSIPQLVNLPGVGENYMDHNVMFVPYFASEDTDSLDAIFRGNDLEVERDFCRFKDGKGRGLMSHNGIDAAIKIRPTADDLKEIGPEFEERWKTYFANSPDKPALLLGTLAAYAGVNPAAPRRKYFSMVYFTAYPVSTGRVHITSGTDAHGRMEFEPGYLDELADLGVLRWAYKKTREIARRMNLYEGDFSPGHPEYPQGSKAATSESAKPADILSHDIEYSAEDNKAIDEYHRKTVETSWHSCGTCAMKPREQGGVVDARLNVYGVKNLKVADCSIMPSNVGANTYNTALAIGEKAAVIIAEDLGIKGVSEA